MRGEYTKISNCGRGAGRNGSCVGVELEREIGRWRAVVARPEVVRAQRRLDDREEAAQDAVLVEALDGLDRRLDPRRDRPSASSSSPRARVEARVEELDERARRSSGCARERLLHVAVR